MLSSFGYFSTAHMDYGHGVVGPSLKLERATVTTLPTYTLDTAFAKPVVFILN